MCSSKDNYVSTAPAVLRSDYIFSVNKENTLKVRKQKTMDKFQTSRSPAQPTRKKPNKSMHNKIKRNTFSEINKGDDEPTDNLCA